MCCDLNWLGWHNPSNYAMGAVRQGLQSFTCGSTLRFIEIHNQRWAVMRWLSKYVSHPVDHHDDSSCIDDDDAIVL
jgi:hypothetical protein